MGASDGLIDDAAFRSAGIAPLLLDDGDDQIITEISKRKTFGQTKRFLQILTISIYLVTWVANGEMLQGISNGLICPGGVPYDKPAAITWFSYNYMLLSSVFVCTYVKWYRKSSLVFYIRHVWAGRWGLKGAVLACAAISYALQFLNITYIIGVECISVSLSNAIYQLQTVFTVGLSACLLSDKFTKAHVVGVAVSTLGVAMVVLPPLFWGDGDSTEYAGQDQYKSCPSKKAPIFFGMAMTTFSAAIGGAYLVSWRVFDEKRRDPATKEGRLEGFVNTHMTLSVIGLCNLVLGWPLLPALHWLGFEFMLLPPTRGHWWVLNWNGMIEYAFDASCAAAIYITSPVVTAIVAPLTIPLSLAVDKLIYDNADVLTAGNSAWMWLGISVILAGVIILETKPNFQNGSLSDRRCKNAESTPLIM